MLAERTWVGSGRSCSFGRGVRDRRRGVRDPHPAGGTADRSDRRLGDRALPGPVAVTYEAGPTGFGLARALAAAGVRCEVVAPSKLERPAGDKVKTDRRDAERLARLLRIGELPAVRVPSEAEEAARDLVRAREDARGDLMRARHRLSKLLLRQGIVWDRSAWTGEHTTGCAASTSTGAGCSWPSTRPSTRCSRCTPAATGSTPRSKRWPRRAAGRAGGTAALPARGLHADRGRALRRGRRLAPLHRLDHRLLPRAGALGVLLRGPAGPGRRSPRPATPTPAGCWSKPPGTTVARCAPAGNAPGAPTVSPPRCGRAPRPATAACTNAGAVSSSAASARRCRWSPSPASSPAGAGASRCSTRTRSTSTSTTRPPDTRPPHRPRRAPGADAGSAWSDPRVSYEQLRPTLIERGDARP